MPHNLSRTHNAIVSWQVWQVRQQGGQKKGPEKSGGKVGERSGSRHMGLIANQVFPAPAPCGLPCVSLPPRGTPPSRPMQATCIQPDAVPPLPAQPWEFSLLSTPCIVNPSLWLVHSSCWSVSLQPSCSILLLHKMFPEGKDCIRNLLLFPKPYRALVLRKHLLEKVRAKTPEVK